MRVCLAKATRVLGRRAERGSMRSAVALEVLSSMAGRCQMRFMCAWAPRMGCGPVCCCGDRCLVWLLAARLAVSQMRSQVGATLPVCKFTQALNTSLSLSPHTWATPPDMLMTPASAGCWGAWSCTLPNKCMCYCVTRCSRTWLPAWSTSAKRGPSRVLGAVGCGGSQAACAGRCVVSAPHCVLVPCMSSAYCTPVTHATKLCYWLAPGMRH